MKRTPPITNHYIHLKIVVDSISNEYGTEKALPQHVVKEVFRRRSLGCTPQHLNLYCFKLLTKYCRSRGVYVKLIYVLPILSLYSTHRRHVIYFVYRVVNFPRDVPDVAIHERTAFNKIIDIMPWGLKIVRVFKLYGLFCVLRMSMSRWAIPYFVMYTPEKW